MPPDQCAAPDDSVRQRLQRERVDELDLVFQWHRMCEVRFASLKL